MELLDAPLELVQTAERDVGLQELRMEGAAALEARLGHR